MSLELRIGWTASVLLHLLLFLLSLFYLLPQATPKSEFVELDWGAITGSTPPGTPEPAPAESKPSVAPTKPSRAPVVTRRRATTQPARSAERRIALPERRIAALTDDAISVPRQGDKMDLMAPAEMPGRVESAPADRVDGAASRSVSIPGRSTDRPVPGVSGAGSGSGVGRPGPGQGAGVGAGPDIQWTGGGTRKKLSGDLPKYPEGTNVSAQVRIRAWVLPNGAVRAVAPVQKANTALENAAMKELKLWRFEPLPGSLPQVEQDCIVTFDFRLR